jgi:hypothetical protein
MNGVAIKKLDVDHNFANAVASTKWFLTGPTLGLDEILLKNHLVLAVDRLAARRTIKAISCYQNFLAGMFKFILI